MKSSEMETVITKAYSDEWEKLYRIMEKQHNDNGQRLVFLMTTVSCKLTALNSLLSLLFVELEQDEEE
jgi:hypothetical protein